MQSSRIKLVVLFFGLFGLLAAACGSSDDSGSADGGPDKIKLTLQWVTQAQFAGYHAALDQGFYADENLEVTIQPGRSEEHTSELQSLVNLVCRLLLEKKKQRKKKKKI